MRMVTLPTPRQLLHGGGMLTEDLGEHFHCQKAYGRSVALDQVGSETYARQRRDHLAKLPGAHVISAQYGINLAHELEELKSLHGLRLENPHSGQYQREFQSEQFHADCRGIYERQGGLPGDKVVFVHSAYAAGTVLKRMSEETREQAICKTLAPGLTAITFHDWESLPAAKRLVAAADHLITVLGARPSAYCVARLACDPSAVSPTPDVAISNRHLLARLDAAGPGSAVDQLRSIEPSHASYALAQASVALIEDMAHILKQSAKTQAFDNDPVLADGLQILSVTAKAMPTLAHDSERFSNAYRAMVEELHVVLSTSRPYSEVDFKNATRRQFEARMGQSARQQGLQVPETFLMASGMGALTCGFEVAAMLNGHQQVKLASSVPRGYAPDYYEIQQLLSRQNIVKSSDTISATLNPSTTQKRGAQDKERAWNVHALIEALQNQLQERPQGSAPLTVVLDATIERRGDMEAVLGRFAGDIMNGRLRMVVCKSYQKFANLCTSKVMAGSITLLSANDEDGRKALNILRKTEQDVGWWKNEETQLLTHFLRNGDPHEFSLLERAAKNAAFVQEQCFGGSSEHPGFDKYDEGLPLAVMDLPGIADHTFGLSDRTMRLRRSDHLYGLIPGRDSFAFAETTSVGIQLAGSPKESALRLSFGQESRAELVEKFHTAGLLMRLEGSNWGSVAARDHVLKLVDEAMMRIKSDETPDKYSLKEKIAIVGAAESMRLSDGERKSATVQQMLSHLKGDDRQNDFTVNKIASVVEHFGRIITFNDEWEKDFARGPDREIADQLIGDMLSSGMPGVSASGRLRVVQFQTSLAAIDMRSDDIALRRRGAEALLKGARQLAAPEERAKQLAAIPDSVFGELEANLRDRLIEHLFRPLDMQARRAFIESRIAIGADQVANACEKAMKRDMQASEKGQLDLLRPETLTSFSHNLPSM